MEFTKMHGCGNDFIIINGLDGNIPRDLPRFTQRICDRHFGLGGDGLLVVLPSDFADIRMVIINSDGSEAQMCGNGVRCFAGYVYEQGIVKKEKMIVETAAGTIKPHLMFDGDVLDKVEVNMGIPRLKPWEIPVDTSRLPQIPEEEQIIAMPMELDGHQFDMTCVSMGNPHVVTFWPDISKAPVENLGPVLEAHPIFPQRVNVEFVQIIDSDEIKMRVYERGVGETLACGTGAAASVVAAILNGFTNRKVRVRVLGGVLFYDWREDGHLMMSGPIAKVATGNYVYEE